MECSTHELLCHRVSFSLIPTASHTNLDCAIHVLFHMHAIVFVTIVLMCGASLLTPIAAQPQLNQIQVLGSHNSYHQGAVPSGWVKPIVQYSHPPVKTQLDLGVRQLEFDISGFYGKNDFYVGHVPRDYGTSCATLSGCFGLIAEWSARANYSHAPIFIYVEVKDTMLKKKAAGRVEAIVSALERLASRIWKSHFLPASELIGTSQNLREALISSSTSNGTSGWPSYSSARGRILLFVTGAGWANSDASIRQQAINAFSRPTRQVMAMVAAGDPLANSTFTAIIDASDITTAPNGVSRINAYVQQGYLVRVRADADLVEVRSRNLSTALLCLQSGAQLISTDVPYAASKGSGNYSVRFYDTRFGVRCNPVLTSAGSGCVTANLEPKSLEPPYPPKTDLFWCCQKGLFTVVAFFIAVLCFVISFVLCLCTCCIHSRVRHLHSNEMRAYHKVEDEPQYADTPAGNHVAPLSLLFFLSFFTVISFLLLPVVARALLLRQKMRGEDTLFSFVIFVERLAVALWMPAAMKGYNFMHSFAFRQYGVISVITSILSVICAFFNRWGAANLHFWHTFYHKSSSFFPLLVIENTSFLIAIILSCGCFKLHVSRVRTSFYLLVGAGCFQLLVLTVLGNFHLLPPFYDVVSRETRALVWYLMLRAVEIVVWLAVIVFWLCTKM